MHPYNSSHDEKITIDHENKLKYEKLLQEGKKIEEEAKVTQKHKKRSEVKQFKEMMDALKTAANQTETISTTEGLTSCVTANDNSAKVSTTAQSEIHMVIRALLAWGCY